MSAAEIASGSEEVGKEMALGAPSQTEGRGKLPIHPYLALKARGREVPSARVNAKCGDRFLRLSGWIGTPIETRERQPVNRKLTLLGGGREGLE